MRIQGAFPIHPNGFRPRRFLADRRAMMRLDAVIHGTKAIDYQLIHKIEECNDGE